MCIWYDCVLINPECEVAYSSSSVTCSSQLQSSMQLFNAVHNISYDSMCATLNCPLKQKHTQCVQLTFCLQLPQAGLHLPEHNLRGYFCCSTGASFLHTQPTVSKHRRKLKAVTAVRKIIHHNCFMAFFPEPPGCAGARRELLDFMVQGKINRGRHSNHPAGRHSIQTNQCPPPPSPHVFYRPDALHATQPTVSKQ